MPRENKRTPEIAAEICERLAQGESLRSICRDDHLPQESSVRQWVVENADFASQYARSRDRGLDSIADEMFDIADDGTNDWIERESKRTGQTYIALNDEAVQRSRLRVDTRKWYLSKLAPKRYGEKQTIEHSGPNGEPIQIEDRAAKAARLLQLAAERKAKIDDDLDGLV